MTGQVNANGNLRVGSTGTAILAHYSASASLDFPNTLTLACSNLTITVTGALAGDTVVATPTAVASGIETALMSWNSWVSAANTVTVRACNFSTAAINPAAETWRVDVWHH